MQNHDEFWDFCLRFALKNPTKKGAAAVPFLGMLFLLLFSLTVMTQEVLALRVERRMIEQSVIFDYQLEALYLLILTGERHPEEGEMWFEPQSFGTISTSPDAQMVVRVLRNGDSMLLEGFFYGDLRGQYRFKRQQEIEPQVSLLSQKSKRKNRIGQRTNGT